MLGGMSPLSATTGVSVGVTPGIIVIYASGTSLDPTTNPTASGTVGTPVGVTRVFAIVAASVPESIGSSE